MKKFITFMIAVLFTITVSAQSQTNYAGSSRFLDNWSVGIGGGVSTNLHHWNTPQGGHVNIELNRSITPIWGISLHGQVGFNDLANYFDHPMHVHNGTVVDNASALVMGTFNFSNAFFGYNGKPRVFEVVGRAGIGYGHGFDRTGSVQSSRAAYKDALLTKTGIDFNFNLDKNKAWTLSVRPSVTFNTTGLGEYNSRFSTFNVDGLIVYHFKTSNGKHYMVKPVLYNQSEVDLLNEQINSLRNELKSETDENDSLRQMLKIANEQANNNKDNEIVNVIYKPVYFKKASAKFEGDLTGLANQIKSSGKQFAITGYASMEGSEKFNKNLSIQRAQFVKQELIKLGCDKTKLRVVTGGPTDKFGTGTDNYQRNRVVISEVEQ